MVTLSHTIALQPGAASLAGVIGLDFSYGAFDRLVKAAAPCDDNDCFLMDSSGYLITYKDFSGDSSVETENVFVGVKEPALAKLLVDEGFLRMQTYRDFKSQQRCSSFLVAIDAPGLADGGFSARARACGSGRVFVTYVGVGEGTSNIFLVVKENWRPGIGCDTPLPTCRPLVAASPCDKSDDMALSRSRPPCTEFSASEDSLEALRASDPDGGSCNSSAGLIAGLVVAAVVACFCAVALIVFVCKKK